MTGGPGALPDPRVADPADLSTRDRHHRVVGPHALRTMLDLGGPLAVLDVREARHVDAGHIPGASNVPRRALVSRIETLVSRRDIPIVLYDDDGLMAPYAARTLVALGHEQVAVLDGGLDAWAAAGHHVATGRNVMSKGFGELVQHHEDVPTVSPDELIAWRAEGRDVVVFDIRTHEEHERETIPGSVHVPGFELPGAIDRLTPADVTVVVHCSGRTRSIIQAQTLRVSGRSNVAALENGTMGWVLSGREPDRGVNRTATDLCEQSPPSVRQRWAVHARGAGARSLSPRRFGELLRAQDLTARPIQLFDVRLRHRFDAGHIAGAAWVPSGQLVQRVEDHVVVRNAIVMIVCDDGLRSSIAAYWLRRMGHNDVIVLDGGMIAWTAAGLEVTTDDATPAVSPGFLDDLPAAGVTAAELIEEPAAAPALVSLLPSDAHADEHPRGAIWISATWLERDLERGFPDRSRRMVLICEDGQRSRVAAWEARRAGWTGATWLDGGMSAWIEASGSTDHGLADDLDPDDHFPHPITMGSEAMRAYLDWERGLGDGQQV